MEQPALVLRIYFELCRFIGIFNIRYDGKCQRFVLNHSPTVIYCLCVDVIYLCLLPLVFGLMIRTVYRCQSLGLLAMVYHVVALSKVISVMLLICSIWFFRRRVQSLGNGYLRLMDKYRQGFIKHCKGQYLRKLTMSSARFVAAIIQLLGPGTGVRCGRRSSPPLYIASVMFVVLMELLLSCVEYTVFMLMVSSNWILICMRLEVKEMTLDVDNLPARNGGHRRVRQSQLLNAWRLLWQRSMRLEELLSQLLQIFQWQLLFNLFSSYLSDIATVFRLLMYAEYDEDFNLWKFLFFLAVVLVHHSEMMMLFHIFEKNHAHWLKLLKSLAKLWSRGQLGMSKGLSRQMEFAILRLCRKLQPHPKRFRELHIAGLFDMRSAAAYSMSSSMASNVLILLQIAYKNYF